MRIDRFLKLARLIKRRGVAKEACDQKRVVVNGRTAKPGTEIKVGDLITLRLGTRQLEVEVVRLENVVRKEEAVSLYRVVREERIANAPPPPAEEDDWIVNTKPSS